MDCRVFISYKHSDKTGAYTEDYEIAKEVYECLKSRNITTFFSDRTLFESGKSDYKKAIDSALDRAELMLVVATSDEFVQSGWVEYEYETFYEDILSGRKTGANIFSYTKNIKRLPRTLSRHENFIIGEKSVEELVDYISNALSNDSAEEPAPPSSSTTVKKEKSVSAYSSDYKNELRRLEIQAINSRETDQEILEYYYEQIGEREEGICVLDVGSAYGFVASDRFGKDDRVKKILCIDNNERVLERAQVLFAENEKIAFALLDVESENFVDELKKAMERNGIERIDLVFSALTLHHLKDPLRALRKIRSVMEKDSYIILRGSDDGSKLCYPNSELMQKIISLTVTANKVSDRFNGRKIYSQLLGSGFKDAKMFSRMRDISGYDFEQREALFSESFSYRINYFSKMLDNNPSSAKAQKEYDAMKSYLEDFENNFFEQNFWYCEYDYVGIAKK